MDALLLILGLSTIAITSPVADPKPEPLSIPQPLPPLPIPGFPVIINNAAPPGVVLQPPTPALDSPPFTGSDIKPQKIGYFWTGAGDNKHKGRLHEFPYLRHDADPHDTLQISWLLTVSTM